MILFFQEIVMQHLTQGTEVIVGVFWSNSSLGILKFRFVSESLQILK